MTVYVDNMRAKFRRMVMCRMIADTEEELHAMADKIGLKRRWYQGDHYDVSLSLRRHAVAEGAIEITQRQLGCMAALRRFGAKELPKPEDAEAALQKRIRVHNARKNACP